MGDVVYVRTTGAEPGPGIEVRSRELKGRYPPRLFVSPGTLVGHPELRAFVLVVVDVEGRRGAVLGWASRFEVQRADTDASHGHPVHMLRAAWLHPLPVAAP